MTSITHSSEHASVVLKAAPQGRCVVAKSDLSAGTKLFTEPAVAFHAIGTLPESGGASAAHLGLLRELVNKGGKEIIPSCLRGAVLDESLSLGIDLARVLEVLEGSGFSLPEALDALRLIQCTAFGVFREEGECGAEERTKVGVGLFSLHSCFNHSCYPNALAFTTMSGGSSCILESRTLRDVKRGEELCISYTTLFKSRCERQAELQRVYGFACKCERCMSEEERGSMVLGCSSSEVEDVVNRLRELRVKEGMRTAVSSSLPSITGVHATTRTRLVLAQELLDRGLAAEASTHFAASLRVLHEVLPRHHPDCAQVALQLGRCLYTASRTEIARLHLASRRNTEAIGCDEVRGRLERAVACFYSSFVSVRICRGESHPLTRAVQKLALRARADLQRLSKVDESSPT